MPQENSQVNIEMAVDTSKLGTKFEQVNKLISQSEDALKRLDRAGNQAIINRKTLDDVLELKRSLEGVQSTMQKVAQTSQQVNMGNQRANTSTGRKNTNKRSQRNRNANKPDIKIDSAFSTQIANQLSTQINQALAQATKQINSYQSGSYIVPTGRNNRGSFKTNQSYAQYRQADNANHAGSRYANNQRADRTELGKYVTQADRSIRQINDSGGRITAQGRKSYDRKMNAIGDTLGGFDDSGISTLRQSQMQERARIAGEGSRIQRRVNELGNKGVLTSQERSELGTLKSDQNQNVKSSNAIEETIAQTEKLEQKFRELRDAEKDIVEVTPSRRSAFVTYAGISAARGMASSGEQILNAEQADTRSISASNGLFNSYDVRKRAERAGMQYGISGSEMLANENSYIQGAGNQGTSDVTKAGFRTGILSRLTGATAEDSRSLTTTYASNVNGADANGLQSMQQVFEGAMSKSGMSKYGASQVKALNSLVSQVAHNNGGSLTQNQVEGLANTSGQLAASGDKALMGENGSNTLSTIDSGIRNGGQNPMLRTAFLMSNPERYGNGIEGWANMQGDMQKGATAENLQRLFGKNAQRKNGYGGISSKAYDQIIGQNLRINGNIAGKVADALDKNGGKQLTNSQMKKLGVTYEDGQYKSRKGSFDERTDVNNASQEQADAQIGQWTQSVKALVGSTIIATGGLSAFNVALRGAITVMEAMLPLKAGRAVASGLANRNSGNRYSEIRNTSGGKGTSAGKGTSFVQTGSGSGTVRSKGGIDIVERVHSGSGISTPGGLSTGSQATSLRERATNSINSGGGKIGSRIRSTSLGGKFASGATTLLASAPVTKGAGAISSVSSKVTGVAGKIKSNPLVSKATSIGSRVGSLGESALGKALPFLPAGMEAVNAVGDKQNRGSHIGGAVGSVAGTVLGSAFGPLGGFAGGMAGQFLGNSVGSLFDSQSKRKDDEANTQKKSAVENKREKNIKADSALTDKQLRLAGKPGKSGSNKGSREGTTKSSTYDNTIEDTNKADEGKKKKAKETAKAKATKTSSSGSSETAKVLVSGTINHTGTVADTSQLEAQTNEALNRLLTNPSANEMTRA